MNLFYGRWSREELEERQSNGSVFQPFQVGSTWYRVRELSVNPLGANYQAEEIPEPSSVRSEPTAQPESRDAQPESREPTPVPLVPPPIRSWARKNGLLPGKHSGGSRGNGPAYLPKAVRDAYQETFGREVLAQMLRSDSLDARRLYADEGDYDPIKPYKKPSKAARENLPAAEIEARYWKIPKQTSEARVAARDAMPRTRQEKRESAIAAGKQVTDPTPSITPPTNP